MSFSGGKPPDDNGVPHILYAGSSTRNSLWAAEGRAIATRPKTWFFMLSLISLLPIICLIFLSALFRPQFLVLSSWILRLDHCDVRSVALAMTMGYMYTAMAVISFVSYQFPVFFALHQLLPKVGRCRRTHSRFMRRRNLRGFIRNRPFTIFILGASARSVPLVVSNKTTVGGIFQALRHRKLIPSTHSVHHRLYSSGRQLQNDDSIGKLCLGPMSHIQLRILVFGGADSQDEWDYEESDLPSTPRRRRISRQKSPKTASNTRSRQATATPGPSARSTPDSPAKGTRSHTSAKKAVKSQPVIIQSPSKSRKKMSTDLAVWDLADEEIITEARTKWISPVYDHYNVSLVRHVDRAGKPDHLTFKFTCRHGCLTHKAQSRDRQLTGQGTTNLTRSAKTCDSSRGVKGDSNVGGQQTLTKSVSEYTPARHRAVIAMRCASSYRPFNSVKDPHYLEEVELLRPGTKVPSPDSVSRDVRFIYAQASALVREFFAKLDGGVHLVMDGWTSPFVASYLGIVVIWFSHGKIWRSILEFIRLTERHTGEYLAKVTADCLTRFGLERKIHTLCMDNASNCDKAAVELGKLLPHFRGAESRTRCFPHTVNLVAKAFISFFFRQPKAKKKVKTSAGAKRKRDNHTSGPSVEVTPDISLEDDDSDAEEDPAAQEVAEHDSEEIDQSGAVDDAKADHDEKVVKSLKALAIQEARQRFRLILSTHEEQTALGLFPKVAGLARRLHDSPTLQEKFEKLVEAGGQHEGQKRALDRRVPTRWNSDYNCLAAHVYFEAVVRQLTIL